MLAKEFEASRPCALWAHVISESTDIGFGSAQKAMLSKTPAMAYRSRIPLARKWEGQLNCVALPGYVITKPTSSAAPIEIFFRIAAD